MIGALWNGISGLNSYQNALNVESNNVANVNTIGYKSDKVSFADMMYQDGVGKGSKQASIDKNFAQGNLKITGGDYDFAVDGKGFFVVRDEENAENLYSRAGNFRIGNDGKLQTPDGFLVQGIPTNTPTVISTDPNVNVFNNNYSKFLASKAIQSDTQLKTINAKSTDYTRTSITDGTSGTDYKTSSSKISDAIALTRAYSESLNQYAANPVAGVTPTNQSSTIDFTSYASQLTQSDNYIEAYIDGSKVRQYFDTDAQTTLNKFADEISKVQGMDASANTVTGTISINSLIPGKDVLITSAMINNTPFLVDTTAAISGEGLADVNAIKNSLAIAIQRAGGEFLDVTNTIDTSRELTLDFADLQMKLDTLGISDNEFGTPEIDNGVIYLKQGDNKFAVGKVTTATFTDQLGLNPKGNNVFSASEKSGVAKDASSVSNVLGGTLELSNSELSEGLVNLMVYQRAFEANSKTLTTSDEFLTTAINLKK